MAVEVRIPTVFQKLVGGEKAINAEGASVAEVISVIDTSYPGFRERLTNEEGEIHRFVNIYVNNEDIRYLENLDTALASGDVVTILPAVAGGAL